MGSASSHIEKTWPAKSKTEICEFFGITEKTLRAWQARGMQGRAGEWDLGKIARWKIEQVRNENKTPAAAIPAGDREQVAAKLATDKIREQSAKADLAELKARRQKRELVEVAEVSDFLSRTAGKLRDALDRLQRDCGPRAFAIVSEVLDELDAEIDSGPIVTTDESDDAE